MIDKTKTPLRTVSASDIGFAFIALRESVDKLRAMLLASDLPVWVFPSSINPRQSAVDRLCRLWVQDSLGSPKQESPNQEAATQAEVTNKGQCESGIMCVDQVIFDHVAVVNNAKATFKHLCETMAKEDLAINGKRRRVKTTVHEERKRNTALAHAFRSIGISQIKLRWCYNQIHTIDKPIYRIGFTWQRSHSDRKRLSRDEAVQLCKASNGSPSQLMNWENTLLSYPERAFFVRTKKKNEQQRANYVFTRGGPNNTIVTPGVVLILSDTLPTNYNAKSIEEVNKLVSKRIDSLLSLDNYLDFLGLYLLPEEVWEAERLKRNGGSR